MQGAANKASTAFSKQKSTHLLPSLPFELRRSYCSSSSFMAHQHSRHNKERKATQVHYDKGLCPHSQKTQVNEGDNWDNRVNSATLKHSDNLRNDAEILTQYITEHMVIYSRRSAIKPKYIFNSPMLYWTSTQVTFLSQRLALQQASDIIPRHLAVKTHFTLSFNAVSSCPKFLNIFCLHCWYDNDAIATAW
jgi:hypothetical protein